MLLRKSGFFSFFIALIQFLLAFAEPEPEIVEYMMECGSPIDARTIYSALMGPYRFTRSGRDLEATYLEILLRTLSPQTARELVNWLLEEGFPKRSLVPLQYATIRGFLRSAQVVMKYGADPKATRENGHIPPNFARDLVNGNIAERMAKIPDTPVWPRPSYGMFTCHYRCSQPTDHKRRCVKGNIRQRTNPNARGREDGKKRDSATLGESLARRLFEHVLIGYDHNTPPTRNPKQNLKGRLYLMF
jgi:hypothetical protein